MVKSIRLSLFASIALLFSLSASADLASVEQIQAQAASVQSEFEAFKASPQKGTFKRLADEVETYKTMIDSAREAIALKHGGAATKSAIAAVRAVSEYGIDIVGTLFAYQTENAELLKENKLDQDIEDLMTNKVQFPLLQLAFGAMRQGVDEKHGVDGKVSLFDTFRRTIQEVGRDLSAYVTGGTNKATGEFYLTGLENRSREKMTNELIPMYQQLASLQIPAVNLNFTNDGEYNRENHYERAGGLLLWLTDRAVNIRVERNSAQKYATLFYAVSGFLLAQPIWNFAGNSYTAHLETSIVIATAAAAITFMKFSMSSVKSTGKWLELSKQVRSEMAAGLVESTEVYLKKTAPTEYFPATVPKWIQRRVAIRNAITGFLKPITSICEKALGLGKPKAPQYKWGRQPQN